MLEVDLRLVGRNDFGGVSRVLAEADFTLPENVQTVKCAGSYTLSMKAWFIQW